MRPCLRNSTKPTNQLTNIPKRKSLCEIQCFIFLLQWPSDGSLGLLNSSEFQREQDMAFHKGTEIGQAKEAVHCSTSKQSSPSLRPSSLPPSLFSPSLSLSLFTLSLLPFPPSSLSLSFPCLSLLCCNQLSCCSLLLWAESCRWNETQGWPLKPLLCGGVGRWLKALQLFRLWPLWLQEKQN